MDNDSASSTVRKPIAVLMNVAEPLETLRKLLESQLHCSLEQFEFWLQDTMKVCLHVAVFLLFHVECLLWL